MKRYGVWVALWAVMIGTVVSAQELEIDFPEEDLPLSTVVPTTVPEASSEGSEPSVIPTVLPEQATAVPTATIPLSTATAVPVIDTPTPQPSPSPLKTVTPTATPTEPVRETVSEERTKEEKEELSQGTGQLIDAGQGSFTIIERCGFLAPVRFSHDAIVRQGVESKQTLLGLGDRFVMELTGSTKVVRGETFVIYREVKQVVHPVTGTVTGVAVLPVAGGVVEKIEGKLISGRLTISYGAVRSGDKSVFQGYWRSTSTDKDKAGTRIRSVVVMEKTGRRLIGAGDIVYIDKGSNDGVAAKDDFRIVKDSPTEGVKGSSLVSIGVIRILATLPDSSIGQVGWSREAVIPGDVVEKVTKE